MWSTLYPTAHSLHAEGFVQYFIVHRVGTLTGFPYLGLLCQRICTRAEERMYKWHKLRKTKVYFILKALQISHVSEGRSGTTASLQWMAELSAHNHHPTAHQMFFLLPKLCNAMNVIILFLQDLCERNNHFKAT